MRLREKRQRAIQFGRNSRSSLIFYRVATNAFRFVSWATYNYLPKFAVRLVTVMEGIWYISFQNSNCEMNEKFFLRNIK